MLTNMHTSSRLPREGYYDRERVVTTKKLAFICSDATRNKGQQKVYRATIKLPLSKGSLSMVVFQSSINMLGAPYAANEIPMV